MIAFVHIPKTAGTSLESLFREVYGAHACYFTNKWEDGERMLRNPEEFTKYEVVGGHLPMHYFDSLPIQHYVSVFRKPIARYVSHFHHIGRTAEHPLHEKAKSMKLVDFLQFDERPNEQCWYFDGRNHVEVIERLVAPPTMILGIMEDLPSFQKLLTRYLGKKFPAFPKLNVALADRLEIEPELADDIALRVFSDLKLYNYVRKYCQEQLALITKC